MLRKLLTIILLFGFSYSSFSQSQSGTLKGKVTENDSSEPIPMANIVIELNGVIVGGAVADFDGEYTIKPMPEFNGLDVVRLANTALREAFDVNFEMGEPIVISEIFKVLKSVQSVLDVAQIDVVSKVGGLYSLEDFDMQMNRSRDGRTILIPETHIFELKYPNVDIVGTVL